MSQPPARPWFRLASLIRPATLPPTRPPAPPPVQQQTFRPPVTLPQATQDTPPPPPPPPAGEPVLPRASAPPSPIPPTTPAPMSSPVPSPPPRATAPPLPTTPSPPPPRATAPPSPIPLTTPAPMSSPVPSPPPRATAPPLPTTPSPPPPRATAPPSPPAVPSPKSPAKTNGGQTAPSTTRSPTATPAQSPPPPISPIHTSPLITKISSSLPASPGQKASPKISATRPDASHSSLPPSPKTKPSAPPPSPLPTSPASQTVPSLPAPPQPSPVLTAAPIATVTARATTPIASAKIDKPWVETPPQSAKEKLLSHPPSPLKLPPARLKEGSELEPIPAEVKQKIVLLQVTEEKSKMTSKTSSGNLQRDHGEAHNHTIAQNGKRELKKDKGVHTHKKHSDSEEYGISVVTLAGENKGAIMELSPSRKKYNGGQKLESNNGEGSSKMKDEKHKALTTQTPQMDAFINCNFQGVNNSVLYNCSCTLNDPGIHLSVCRKGNGGHGVQHKDSVIG